MNIQEPIKGIHEANTFSCSLNYLKVHMAEHQDPRNCKKSNNVHKMEDSPSVLQKSTKRLKVVRSLVSKIHERNTYECFLCSKVFSSRHFLLKHMSDHDTGKQFQCERCNKRFSLRVTLNKHIKTHIGEKMYHCESCDKCFSSKDILDEHTTTHSGQNAYKCDQCGKTFTKQVLLSAHIESLHGDGNMKTYTCSICGKILSSRYYFKVHMAEHDTKRLFKCDTCGRCFVLNCTLKEHLKTHLPDKEFQCDQCDKKFTRKYYLSAHVMNIHNPDLSILHKCRFCNKQFKAKTHLKRHTNEQHGNIECLLCFKLSGDCNCSWKPVEEKYERLRSRLDRENLMMRCQSCSKSILSKTQLKMHLKLHKDYGCIICNEDYKNCKCCDDFMEVSRSVNTYQKISKNNKPSTSVDDDDRPLTEKFANLSVNDEEESRSTKLSDYDKFMDYSEDY